MEPSLLGLALLLVSLSCEDGGPTIPSLPDVTRDGITYSGAAGGTDDGTVIGEVYVINRTDRMQTVRFQDSCVVLTRLYDDETGEIAWDRGDHAGCSFGVVESHLPPEGSETFTTFVQEEELDDAGVPLGTYYVVLYLRPVGEPPIELRTSIGLGVD